MTTAKISQHLTTKKDKKKLCYYFLTCNLFKKSGVQVLRANSPKYEKQSPGSALLNFSF